MFLANAVRVASCNGGYSGGCSDGCSTMTLSLFPRWEVLQSLASQRREALTDALEKATDFNDNWKTEVDWLSEAERVAYADWKPCGLPETCEADTTKHQVSMYYMV